MAMSQNRVGIQAAQTAHSQPLDDEQVEKDLAELPTDPPNLGINTAVIKTKDQMLGTLLDMFG